MLKAFKLLGLLIGLVGIVLLLLDLTGYFVDGDRISLRDEIRASSGRLPETTRGFDKFLQAFPPPAGIDSQQVTHIAKDVIQTHDQFPVSITVRYVASGQRTRPVASFADVERWAAEKHFGWVSWVVAALGWLVVAGVELYEIFQRNPAG